MISTGQPTSADGTVIARTAVRAGHDGAAELVLTLKYTNGAEGEVVLDARLGFQLMARCGVDRVEDLEGHSWRKLLEGACP